MPIRTFLIVIAILLPHLSLGQGESKKDKNGYTVKLLAESFPSNLGKVCLQTADAKSQPFELPTNRLSDAIIVPDRAMVLKLDGKDLPLCKIALPAKGKSFIVVLLTAKPSGFTPTVIGTDDPAFKAGTVFFMNRSDTTILGKLGNTPLVLKAGDSTFAKPSGAVDNTYYKIAFGTRDGKSPDKMISSTRWPVEETSRTFVFFFTNAAGKTTYRAVDEYLTPAATN